MDFVASFSLLYFFFPAQLVLSYYFDLSAPCERRTAVILLGPPWAILKPLALPICAPLSPPKKRLRV